MENQFSTIILADRAGGKLFTCGDIHGHFDLLEQELDKQGFDRNSDLLVSVGDLVDRGPRSVDAIKYLDKGWFLAVRGNHEFMTYPPDGGSEWHVRNGGLWFAELPLAARELHTEKLNSTPFAMEVIVPDGRKFGFVHAAVPSKQIDAHFEADWGDMFRFANNPIMQEKILWDRNQVSRAMKAVQHPNQHRLQEFTVRNVEHVFLGHTPMKAPLTVGNMSWIDTGAFATGVLTVKEVT